MADITRWRLSRPRPKCLCAAPRCRQEALITTVDRETVRWRPCLAVWDIPWLPQPPRGWGLPSLVDPPGTWSPWTATSTRCAIIPSAPSFFSDLAVRLAGAVQASPQELHSVSVGPAQHHPGGLCEGGGGPRRGYGHRARQGTRMRLPGGGPHGRVQGPRILLGTGREEVFVSFGHTGGARLAARQSRGRRACPGGELPDAGLRRVLWR